MTRTFVVVDRILDDESAIVIARGRCAIAEGTWEVTQRYELADGDVVVLPRITSGVPV